MTHKKSTAGTSPLSRREWGVLLVLCAALFLDTLDVSMIGVALPSIRADLHLSISSLQWVVSAYVLGYGGFLLLGGRVADLLGRRRVFILSLAVFLVASGLGGLATAGSVLIATRFIKGVSAAFTAPAGLSIITTTFPEGLSRNKALSIYTATGATGFSAGLLFGGILTEINWRYVFFLPVAVALVTLVAATRLVPGGDRPKRAARMFDLFGAVSLTAAMLLLVFTVVEAPGTGWGSARTLGSFALGGAILALFVARERRTAAPLLRLEILRSVPLVRANLGAMFLFGGWVGFQFVAILYMQQLRGWSPLDAGLAILPSGLLVASIAPRLSPVINRFGVPRLILAGMTSMLAAYLLFLPIGLGSGYASGILPTFLLTGVGFGLAYGPLNIAATNGVMPTEQGLAAGLVNTSFQFGGALGLAAVTAVNNASTAPGHSPLALLHGYRAAVVVSVVAAALGVLTYLVRRWSPSPPEPVPAGPGADEEQTVDVGAR